METVPAGEERLCGETILVLANGEWDWSNRLNCHHITVRLARQNRVIFVDTVGGRTPAPREAGKIVRRLRRIAGGVRRVEPGITVLSPLVVPIYHSEIVRKLNTALLQQQIRRVVPSRTRPILWVFLPSLVGLVGRFHEKLVIYHCVDEHAANPSVPSQQVSAWEQRLLRAADLVFTTSSTLFQDKKGLNRRTFYLPNVADADLFAEARSANLAVADELTTMPHPMAGYIGNISAYKMDFDLLAAAADRNPQWTFVLVGPVGRGDPSTDLSKLTTRKNIMLMGERPYLELPRWVKGFDACLIPFNLNNSTRGSLPMKFFEYLAAGKPVIATDLPTLEEFRHLFYPVANAQEFSSALAAVSDEGEAQAAARIQSAARYSWSARMLEIERLVTATLAELDQSPGEPSPILSVGSG